MLVKTKGIVLKETPYSETSKVLNVLTSDYGLIGVLSKGSKNIKSKLRGISNKMVYAEFDIKYKESGLSTLVDGSFLNPFKNIFSDIKKANYSFYLMDLCYQVLLENNDRKIFNILEEALIKINDGLSPELISSIVEVKLLKYLGVSIDLECCSMCGSKDNFITLNVNSGGVVCKSCYKDDFIFNTKTINLLRLIYKIDLGKITNLELMDRNIYDELDNFLKEYYSVYTGIFLKDKKKLGRIIL